jgi:hypothetical protein
MKDSSIANEKEQESSTIDLVSLVQGKKDESELYQSLCSMELSFLKIAALKQTASAAVLQYRISTFISSITNGIRRVCGKGVAIDASRELEIGHMYRVEKFCSDLINLSSYLPTNFSMDRKFTIAHPAVGMARYKEVPSKMINFFEDRGLCGDRQLVDYIHALTEHFQIKPTEISVEERKIFDGNTGFSCARVLGMSDEQILVSPKYLPKQSISLAEYALHGFSAS